MSVGWYAAAAALAGVGAVARVAATQAWEGRVSGGAPAVTGAVNVVGAAALGVLAGTAGGTVLLVLGAGLLGGFTTFSTWMVEVDVAHRAGRLRRAVLTLVLPLVVGVAACAAARALA